MIKTVIIVIWNSYRLRKYINTYLKTYIQLNQSNLKIAMSLSISKLSYRHLYSLQMSFNYLPSMFVCLMVRTHIYLGYSAWLILRGINVVKVVCLVGFFPLCTNKRFLHQRGIHFTLLLYFFHNDSLLCNRNHLEDVFNLFSLLLSYYHNNVTKRWVDYSLFYYMLLCVPFKKYSLMYGCNQLQVMCHRFWFMHDTYGPCNTVTQGLRFDGHIKKTRNLHL